MRESQKLKEKCFADEQIIISDRRSTHVKKLFKIYEADKLKARVYFMNTRESNLTEDRQVIFTKKNGDFEVIHFVKYYGFSDENKISIEEKKILKLKFSKNKFTLTDEFNDSVTPLTKMNINEVLNCCEIRHGSFGVLNSRQLHKFLSHRFTWWSFFSKNSLFESVSYNTFLNKKLFTLKKALMYFFQCSYPIANLLKELNGQGNGLSFIIDYRDYILNIESLEAEWIRDNLELFRDCLEVAKIVGEKVDVSWSGERLKEAYDKWNKMINEVIYVDCDWEMNIGQVFLDFAEFSKYEILKTTKCLAEKGPKEYAYESEEPFEQIAYYDYRINNANYVDRIESELCAVYSENEYKIVLKKSFYKGEEIVLVEEIQTIHGSQENGKKTSEEEVYHCVKNFNKKRLSKVTSDFNYPDESYEIFKRGWY